MDANAIVRRLIENDEDPKDFIERNPDIYPVSDEPTHEYSINLGEGNYRAGLAFTVRAVSRQEAVHLANKFIQEYFYGNNRMGSVDLDTSHAPSRIVNFRAYVDDEIEVTDADIVDESAL